MTPTQHQAHAISRDEAAKNRAKHDTAERLAENLAIPLAIIYHIAQQMNNPTAYHHPFSAVEIKDAV